MVDNYVVKTTVLVDAKAMVGLPPKVDKASASFKKLDKNIDKTKNSLKQFSVSTTKAKVEQTKFKNVTEAVAYSAKKETKALSANAMYLKTNQQFYKRLNAEKIKGVVVTKAAAAATQTLNNRMGSLLGIATKARWMLVNITMAAFLLHQAFKALISPLVELETEMAVVRKRTKMSVEEIKDLRGEFIKLSRTMPESASELAKIGGIAGQLGIRGSKNITEFVRVTAMMGAATVLTSEEAGLALAKLSKAYDLPIMQAENMASVVNELSNNTAANSKEIAAAMLKMATSAHQLGITLDMSAAIGATLVDMGMKAERAGTRMRTVFTRMATQTSKIAELYSDKLSPDIKKAIEEDANEAFLSLIEKISQTTDASERVAIATKIFGRVGGSAVLGLASNYLELVKNMVMASNEFKNAISLQAEFDIQMSTTANQWKIFWGNIGSGWTDFATKMNFDTTGMLKNYNDLNTAAREFRNIHRAIREELGGSPLDVSVGEMYGVGHDMSVRGEQIMRREAKYAVHKGQSYEDYRTSVVESMGLDDEPLTYYQEVEIEFYYTFVKEGMLEARKGITEAEKTLFGEIEAENIIPMSAEEIEVVTQKVKELNIALLDAEGMINRSNRLLELNNYLEEYNNRSTEVIDKIKEEAEAQAMLERRYNTTKEPLLDILQLVEEYNEELEEEKRLMYLAGVSAEEFAKGIDRVKDSHKEAVKYVEAMDRLNKDLKDSTDAVSEAQKRAAFAYGIVNKSMSEQIKNLTDEYKLLKDVRFEGEAEYLENIHAIELAIKKEKLAQMDLTDSINATNDALTDNKDTYDAWVETVNQFIESAIKSGNLLGKNVSGAVKKYQTLLLSTSKFTDEQEEEQTVLEALEDERARAQLEYEIGIGEQHYALEQYIDELENEDRIIQSTVGTAIAALQAKKNEIDEVTAAQKLMINTYEAENLAIKAAELSLDAATLSALTNYDLQLDALNDLIDARRTLNNLQGGGGSSGLIGMSVAEANAQRYADNRIEVPQEGTAQDWLNSGSTPNEVSNFFSSGEDVGQSQSIMERLLTPRYIREFADGGLVTKPTLAMIGESGPEMVIPLTGSNAGAGMNQISIGEINISGVSGDAEDFASVFSEELRRELRTL